MSDQKQRGWTPGPDSNELYVEAMEARASELAPAQCSVAALREELRKMLTVAQWGIANEQLGGNVVKEGFWKGQRSAVTMVLRWLDDQPQNVRVSDRPE